MIGHNVNHHPDVPLVAGSNKILEVLLGSEILVELIDIPAPISMIATITVINDGTDPDGIEPHALDVVKVILQPYVPSSTVPTQVITTLLAAIVTGETIGQHLVDCTGLPLLGCCG